MEACSVSPGISAGRLINPASQSRRRISAGLISRIPPRGSGLRVEFLGRISPKARRLVQRCRASLSPEVRESVDKLVKQHKVVLFMKGNRMFPQCGFSNTVVQILNRLSVPYETVNILEDEGLRQGLKAYSNWPTFPQLYIDGEFFGGCDITLEAYQSGELQETVEKAMLS